VERDNCGWDLVATKESQILHVEVKGCSGPTIYFELTPNEYKKLIEHAVRYRVCVVCNALQAPVVYEFKPKWHRHTQAWRLSTSAGETVVILAESTAAIGREIRRRQVS
jgi:Holliday junction resolvase